MVGTKFTEMERKIALSVPTISEPGALAPAPEKRVINVYQDGVISLDEETVSLSELQSRLTDARSQYQKLGVIVRGDADARHQNVANVLGVCSAAGIAEMGVSVRIDRTRR